MTVSHTLKDSYGSSQSHAAAPLFAVSAPESSRCREYIIGEAIAATTNKNIWNLIWGFSYVAALNNKIAHLMMITRSNVRDLLSARLPGQTGCVLRWQLALSKRRRNLNFGLAYQEKSPSGFYFQSTVGYFAALSNPTKVRLEIDLGLAGALMQL